MIFEQGESGVMSSDLLAEDFSTEPYWADGLPPLDIPEASPPRSVDVAVIGGGFAGLSAAFTLAQGGRSVAIFEARTIGAGAAARAAGSLSHILKASMGDIAARYGVNVAREAYREAKAAREFVESLIERHRIECGLRRCARFIAAHSPRAFARQRAGIEALRASWGEAELVERGRQRELIGSHAFFGGVLVPKVATLNPALLQRGLAGAALAAGAALLQNCRVLAVDGGSGAFEIASERGRTTAREVVLATNAETRLAGRRFRPLARRLVVMPAYAAASEEVPAETVRAALPLAGPVSDTYKIIHYIAPDHTGRRFIVSARAGRADGDLRGKAERMFGYFRERFPALARVRVSHCWSGNFAITGDWIPHAGRQAGIHYVLGCCGTGIPMATYLGYKTAETILARRALPSVFERPLPPLPYFGLAEPLLPLAVRAYEWRDRLLR